MSELDLTITEADYDPHRAYARFSELTNVERKIRSEIDWHLDRIFDGLLAYSTEEQKDQAHESRRRLRAIEQELGDIAHCKSMLAIYFCQLDVITEVNRKTAKKLLEKKAEVSA